MSSTVNVTSKGFRFHRRDQRSGESVTDILAELRRLSINCQFGDYLDQVLCDCFVYGLHSSGMQLAVTDDLPLKKAVDQALVYEAADKSTKDM